MTAPAILGLLWRHSVLFHSELSLSVSRAVLIVFAVEIMEKENYFRLDKIKVFDGG